MAIEEPKYTVTEKSNDFELRTYDPMIVAETLVEGNPVSYTHLDVYKRQA